MENFSQKSMFNTKNKKKKIAQIKTPEAKHKNQTHLNT